MRIAPKTLYNVEVHQQPALNCHRSPLKVAKWIGNMGSGIPNMWLPVFVTPLPLVTWYGACALRQKRFIMGRLISKLPLIVIAAPWSCKVNRQYGVGDSKYVVICGAPTLGHVIRRMRIAPKTLYNGEAHQQTALNCHRSPLKVAKCIANMKSEIPNKWLLVTPYLASRDGACASRQNALLGLSVNDLNNDRSPLKVAKWIGNSGSGNTNMWLFLTPASRSRDTVHANCQKRFIMKRFNQSVSAM